MFRRKLPFLLLLPGFLFPSLSLAQEAVSIETLSSFVESAPAAVVTSPSREVYTRGERVYASVAFASTSQIVDIEYVLNNTYVAYDKPLPFFGLPLGTTTFSVVTEDIFGKVATTAVAFQLATTHQSAPDTIREAYKRGLITKVVIRDRFLRSLEAYADTYEKREKLLASTDKRKEERAVLLSERMQKLLDGDILDLLKKQEGRTIKKEAAVLIREDIEALKIEAGL